MQCRIRTYILILAIGLFGCGLTAQADWIETFDDNAFDLTTWQFLSYPTYTGSFSGTIQDTEGANDYLVMAETSSSAAGGSQFGFGIGSPEEFTDVRVGAVINAASEAAQNYLILAARTTYFEDNGSISGHPGGIATAYIMLIHYQEGPANFRIEVFKIVNLDQAGMKTYREILVPGVDHARSYYAELEVVGSDPVYITGSMYESQGGALLARTPTLVDTAGADPWEHPGISDACLLKGVSAIASMTENPDPAGYRATFDTVSSVAIDIADAHAKDIIIDNFEGYDNDGDIRSAWAHNIPGYDYISLDKDGGDKKLCFQYQNQFDPYFTEAVLTLEPARNWTLGGIGDLSLEFKGQLDNVTQQLSLRLEDAAGASATVNYPSILTPQTKFWRTWDISIQNFEGINLKAVKKLAIVIGDGNKSDQATEEDLDEMLFNNVILRPPQ